jgi:hypothetical protein
MIKFIMTATNTNRKTLGLGITRQNVIKLLQENPIHLHAEDLNMKDFAGIHEVSIAYFDTESELMNFMQQNGLITTETVIKSEEKKSVN